MIKPVLINSSVVCKLLYEKGIETQRELSNLLGYSESYVSELLANKKSPMLDFMIKLSRVLDAPVEDLLQNQK